MMKLHFRPPSPSVSFTLLCNPPTLPFRFRHLALQSGCPDMRCSSLQIRCPAAFLSHSKLAFRHLPPNSVRIGCRWWWGRASCPGVSFDILGTNCDQCLSMVQCCFTSTETVRLVRTESPGRPPRLSQSSWTLWIGCAGTRTFSSAQLSTDAVSALSKVWVLILIRLWKQHSVQART